MKNISDALKVSLGVAFIAEYNAEQVTPTNNVVIKLNFLASQCLNLQPEGSTNTIVGDVAKVFLMIKRIRKIYSIFTNQSGGEFKFTSKDTSEYATTPSKDMVIVFKVFFISV